MAVPAFFFYGDDTYSLNHKLSFWRLEFEKKYGDLNTSLYEGASCTAGEIIDAASAMPFLADKRLIIVKNILSEQPSESHEPLGIFLENVPDSSILIFAETKGVDKRLGFYKKLIKKTQSTEFTPRAGTALVAWIHTFVTTHNKSIESDAALYLGEVVGADLYRLENELIKLIHVAENRSITKHDVEAMVVSSLTTSIFKLTDAISQKNLRQALRQLHILIESGEELHGILYMVMRQFRLITAIKDLADTGMKRDAIIGVVKEHPFVVSNTLQQTRNFSIKQLKKAYDELVTIDTQLKTGGIRITTGDTREFVLALDRLVIELCT